MCTASSLSTFCLANYTKWPQPPFFFQAGEQRQRPQRKQKHGPHHFCRCSARQAQKWCFLLHLCDPLSCLNFPLSNRPYYALRRSSSLMRPTVGGTGIVWDWPEWNEQMYSKIRGSASCKAETKWSWFFHYFFSLCACAKKLLKMMLILHNDNKRSLELTSWARSPNLTSAPWPPPLLPPSSLSAPQIFR